MPKEQTNGATSSLAFGVAERLERRFGLGAKADVRRALYERLQLAVEISGERAFVALRTIAAQAEGKRHPDRYFCFAAVRRLGELGLMPQADL